MAKKSRKRPAKPVAVAPEELLQGHAMEIHIGNDLTSLVDERKKKQGEGLLHRIYLIRQELASEWGFITPPIRIRDNSNLEPNGYQIFIHGTSAAWWKLDLGKYLALNYCRTKQELDGMEVNEPAFNIPAIWIDPVDREKAGGAGYTVVDAETVFATHLTEVIKSYASSLLTLEETNKLLTLTEKYAPETVKQALATVGLGVIHRILQMFLWERLSIRNLPFILDKMILGKGSTSSSNYAAFIRSQLGYRLYGEYMQHGRLNAITLDSTLEKFLVSHTTWHEYTSFLKIRPRRRKKLMDALHAEVQRQRENDCEAVLLVSHKIRAAVKWFTRLAPWGSPLLRLPVLSRTEVFPGDIVKHVGKVSVKL